MPAGHYGLCRKGILKRALRGEGSRAALMLPACLGAAPAFCRAAADGVAHRPPSPYMPGIGHLDIAEYRSAVGVPSSSSTIASTCTPPWATARPSPTNSHPREQSKWKHNQPSPSIVHEIGRIPIQAIIYCPALEMPSSSRIANWGGPSGKPAHPASNRQATCPAKVALLHARPVKRRA